MTWMILFEPKEDTWIRVFQAWLINLARCLHTELVEWNVPATTGVGAHPCFQKNHVLWGIIFILFSQEIQKLCLQVQNYQLKCACRHILKRYFCLKQKLFITVPQIHFPNAAIHIWRMNSIYKGCLQAFAQIMPITARILHYPEPNGCKMSNFLKNMMFMSKLISQNPHSLKI